MILPVRSSVPLPTIPQSSWMIGLGRFLAVCAAALLMSPLVGAAQDAKTQQVQLDEGWNLVSLNVHPGDSSFASIFGEAAGQISMVKDEDGDVYVPSEGIEQISTWRDGKGYRVQAEEATTLDVTGSKIFPENRPIVLEPGGNVVPYLSSTAQPVETALISVEESLLAVEDESGNRYNPSGGASSLDSLRPGQGYKVYVEQADTLVYPRVAGTLEDALALQGMANGDYVQVRGYHEPGDLGGGLFEVRASACRTDGGTCFVFDEDRSGEQSLTTNQTTVNFPHADLVWGSVQIRYGPDDGDVWKNIDMHGHWQSENPDWLNLKEGRIEDGSRLFVLRRSIGGGDGFNVTYRYEHTTADRRLERIGVGNSVSVAWWGAPPATGSDTPEATPYINWAINAAARLYKNSSIDWAYVDIPDEYYYYHPIRLRNGVKLRGVGSERSVPGESWTTRGKLTVKPGKALYHKRTPQLEETVYDGLGATKVHINNHYMAEKWGIENLELDGNYQNNKQPFDENDDAWDTAAMEGWLQNSGDWAGFHTNDSGNQEAGDNPVFYPENVYVHGYGGNGIATGKRIKVEGKNVRAANSVRNHSLYSFSGGASENVTGAGYSWAVPLKLGSKDDKTTTYTDIAYESGDPNPEGYVDKEVFNIIGRNIVMDGITIDMRGGKNRTGWIADKGTSNEYRNATIYTNTSGGFRLQAPRAQPNDEIYANFTIYSNGDGPTIAGRGYTQTGMTFKNFTVEAGQSASGGATNAPLGMNLSSALDNLSTPGRLDVNGLDYNRSLNAAVFKGGGGPDDIRNGIPRDLFVVNSYFENGEFYSDDGRWGGFGDPDENFRNARFYLNNTTINLPSSLKRPQDDPTQRIGGGASKAFKLRDVQDNQGRVSEESGTYTSGAGDEGNDYVLIPTNLIFRAYETETSLISSPSSISSVTSVGIANSDGTLRPESANDQQEPYLKVSFDGTIDQDEAVEVDWTARVTPLGEYQTTGVFISRPLFDRTSSGKKDPLASGSGPFTFDLRGVLVSQESKSTPTYTVSSGDPSVVTAEVQSDGYTLQLTEQGTGTATITVMGEIPGIGTATDTFEVTVE